MKKTVYLFDLDSTVTRAEILPTIAENFGVAGEMRELTEKTMMGEIEFEESFRSRVALLDKINISEVASLIAETPVNEELVRFLRENKENCYIVTSNLNVWIEKLIEKIGMTGNCLCSEADFDGDKLNGIKRILSKDDATEKFKEDGFRVVAVGDGSNDRGMLDSADIGIAFGGVRNVSPLLYPVCDFAVFTENRLCDLLNRILQDGFDSGRTTIISCAGMGTRLGRGMPKALVEVGGKTLIERNLDLLKNENDIRVVVGFKAEDVIDYVNKINREILFVFNHDYMNNGTGASVTLAKRFANQMILTIDGDLLIHPQDMGKILERTEEFIGVCEPTTDDPVLTEIEGKNVTEFSRKSGKYEWTGVSLTARERLHDGDNHVCDILSEILPVPYLLIRTKEIDTPHDFEIAEYWVKNNFSDAITIGIGGGMGSYATASLFRRILDAFPAEKEWERPRVIIDNRCNMPSRVRALLYDERREELVESLSEMVKMFIDNNATDIILACNTSHVFLDEVLEKVPEVQGKIINIIEECARGVSRQGLAEVRLFASEGTIDSEIYQKHLGDVKCIVPSKNEYARIRKWIEVVKQNEISDEVIADFTSAICESEIPVIVGCTELPVLVERAGLKEDARVIDPLECAIEVLKEHNLQRK